MRVVGVVLSPADDRRTPALRLHGVPLADLAAAAARAVCERVLTADVPLDLDVDLAGVDLVLVHDPSCPLLPSAALADCVAAADAETAAVGVRPVTDTIKRVEDGLLRATVDRDQLWALASPVVLPIGVLARLGIATTGDLADLSALVAALQGVCALTPVPVPAAGRRVSDADDLAVLAGFAELPR